MLLQFINRQTLVIVIVIVKIKTFGIVVIAIAITIAVIMIMVMGMVVDTSMLMASYKLGDVLSVYLIAEL